MAKAWVSDRWVKDTLLSMPDGTTQRISSSALQLKSLKTLSEHFRTRNFRNGSRWQVRWYDLNDTGLQKPRKKQFKRRSEADEFAAELEDDMRSGRYIDPSQDEQIFREVATTWPASKSSVKGSTMCRYLRELDYSVLPKWGNIQIGRSTRPKIDAWVSELREGTAPWVISDSNQVSRSEREGKPPR